MKSLIITIIVFASLNSTAQDVPVAVKSAFQKSFPNTTVKKWDKENGDYEANFIKDKKSMSATFDMSGNWKETETDIKVSELPSPVINYIKTNYKDASIKEAAIMQTASSKMYEAEVKGKDLLFDMNGKFVKEEDK